MTQEELNNLFTEHHKILPKEMWPTGILSKISVAMTLKAEWGLNPKNVKLLDFEIAVAVVFGDKRLGIGVNDQMHIGFKHNITGKSMPVDVYYIDTYGAYPTATELINLA